MSILKDINAYLETKENVRKNVKGKVFASRVPQWVKLPYVQLRRISTDREYHLLNETDLALAVVQLDIYTDGLDGHLLADEIAEDIRMAMSGYRGAMGDSSVRECIMERDNELTERPIDGSDNWTYRRSMDFRIAHNQTVPTH